ncbi:YciI family protein [Cellulomonas carbonis]|uniref:YciI family protein n=1 Tax=Cellulomonas carbonis TaxID=1386092 RepID=UPI00166E24C9|nr:YciI family protein [Cellulomonas carbonis]GGC16033.1 hypothetical protein GCM10010972_31640 [Cellulomonas carbonis]
MTQYVLSLWEPVGPPPPPELLEPVMVEVGRIDQDMRDEGVWVFAAGLHGPGSSTVLRSDGDEVLTVDGPYVEAKEHLGGFSVVVVEDVDAVLEWGRRLTRATGLPIEVRPVRHGGR